MPPVVIGVAAAAGATFASYAVATAVAIGVGAAIATYAITEALTPDLGEMENGLGGDQTLSVGGVQGRREIYGEAIVSGNIVGYGTYTDDEEDKWHVMVIPVADHVCESIELHDIEGKLATETGMSSRIKITTYLGGQSTACPVAKRWATGWTSNHIGHGLSYVTIEIKIDAEFFPNGINRMRFKVKGKKLYDVRKDSTNGGSGTHRFTDETTWEWSSNPILATADFIRFGGYKEQPYERFDWADIAAQANSCDEIVSFTDNNGQAASEARFTCNGSLSKEQSPATNLKRLLSSFAGKIYNVAGKIYLKTGVYQGAPTVTIDKSHCKGQVSYKPYTPIKDRCNIVRTSFVNPKKQYQSTDATPTKNSIYKAADGMTLEHKLTLHMTNSETMCQRIGKGHLEQNRAGFSLRIPLMAIGLLIMPGQAVSINMPEDGIDNVEFKCVDWAWDAKKRTAVLLFGKEGSELYPDDFEPNEQAVPGNEFIDAFEMKDFPTDAITWTNAEAIRKNQGVLSWEYDDSDEDIKYKVKIRQTNESWVSYLDSLLSRTPKYTYFLKKTTSEKALEINSVPTGDYEVLVSAINRMGRYSERSKNITITHQPATLKDIAGWNELPNSGADKTNYSDSRIDNDVAAIAAQTKADLAKKQAKAYADGIVSDEEERAITDASEKANAAQLAAVNAAALDATAKANAAKAIAISTAATAAQAKATLAKTEAKAYADGIVTDEEERAIADATAKANAAELAAKNAAAIDATAKANAAKLEAMNTAALDATEKANSAKAVAISTAATAAQAKATLAKTEAKAYADGIVTDEEERAIEDATAKANAAQSAAINAAAIDATAKANAAKAIAISTAATAAQAKATLAKTEAKAYADGIVTDEEERAIADATAKANAAQSNAISAANSAAQAKADEAEANAKAYADGQFPRYKSLNSIHGTGAITTPQFIIALNAAGAFSGNHNVFKASWNYAGHGYISDTGCGVIDLAGTTIEVIGTGGTYLIRVTSAPSASSHGGLAHTTWEYRNHGSSYNPGWRMILNSGNFQNSVTKPYIDNLDIAASTARKWQTPRTLTTTLTGDVTGSASMLVDGSGNKTATINVSVKDDSHKHVIDNIDHLQAALDLKIGFTDLTYDDVTTYAAAIESVQQFKDWLQSGDADTSAYDLVTPSMATAFINAVIGQFNIVVAAAANIDILDSRLIDVDTLFAKNVITDAMEAKAITADKIDIVNLFAQAITASGSITGAQLIGGIIKTSLATNVDRTIIDGDTIKYYDANQFTPAMVIGTNSVGVARAILELGYTGYNKKAFKAVGATNVGFALATFEQESSGYAAEFIANGVNYGRAILAKSTTKQAALEVSQISSSPSEAAAKFSSSNGHAASFITAASKAPFTVNSSVMVVNLNSYKLGNYTYAQVLSAARAKLGLNADKVDGFHAVKDSYTANQVAVRNSSGDLHARLFRANYTNQSTISGAIAFRVNNGADNYLRYCSSPSAIRTWLDTPEKPVASKTTNGYWKCVETGLIMVWGTATAPANTLSSYVYFPLAFPNACRSLHLTEKTTFTNDLHVLKVNVLEKSRFKAYNTDIARTYTYLAIGY